MVSPSKLAPGFGDQVFVLTVEDGKAIRNSPNLGFNCTQFAASTVTLQSMALRLTKTLRILSNCANTAGQLFSTNSSS